MTKFIAIATTFALSLQSFSALAHPGIHGEEGVVDGLLHQFSQADHLGAILIAAFGLTLAGVVSYRQRKHAEVKK